MNAPGSLSQLQKRIQVYATAYSIPYARVQQRVASEVMFNVLELAKARGVIPTYVVKGGMALEVRFGMRARASKDVDVGLLAPPAELLPLFDRMLAIGFDLFRLRRRGEPQRLERSNTLRLDVVIQYKNHNFFTLAVDLSEASYEPPKETATSGLLPELGLPGPVAVQLLDECVQLAHKIHGATEASTDVYENKRYRDVIDALLFERVRLDGVEPRAAHEPRLQLRAESNQDGTILSGYVSNGATGAANFVRLVIPGRVPDTGPRSQMRFGTVAPGDKIPFDLKYDGQPLIEGSAVAGPIALEFEDDRGHMYRQEGVLQQTGAYDSRPTYHVRGIGPLQAISDYSERYSD